MNKNRLFLLDAYALIYRAYYAFLKFPRIDSKGRNTSAIFGFVNTVEELLQKENPTHIAVGFDPEGPTFRHEAYKQYKAQREATPEVIKSSVPYIKEIIKAYNIPILEVPGFEADDVIGTVAKKMDSKRFDIYMMTSDKDYGQLTEPHIFIYRPKYGGNDYEILDDKKVVEKYNINNPAQVIDMLGLMGDSSDNIPGCPGIGEKTAVKLLNEFGSIDNILENIDRLKGAQQRNIKENREQILFSRFLATIKTDVPIEIDEEEMVLKEKNGERVKQLFEELEFRTLLQRIFKTDSTSNVKLEAVQGQLFGSSDDKSSRIESPQTVSIAENLNIDENSLTDGLNNIHTTPHSYKIVNSEQEMRELCSSLLDQKSVCFDTETTGPNPMHSRLVGLSFAYKEGEAYYVPIAAEPVVAQRQADIFKPFFENERIEKSGHNLKFDIIQLRNYQISVKGALFDTMIAHYLISPEQRHSMDFVAEKYLNYKTIAIDELIGPKGKNQKSMADIDPNIVADYASEDADITLKLKNRLEKEIRESALSRLFYDIESPLIYVLADMEWNGVGLDLNAIDDLSKLYSDELEQVETQITEMAGTEFNVNSPKQTGEILFDRLRIIDNPKKTKTGQYRTGEDELEKIRSKHPIVAKILEQRGIKKLLSTYINAFPLLVNNRTGKIHTSFNQTVTATGRLSSSNPNLQNIPIRDERGRELRKLFIPDNNCLFVSSDYSQIELRIMAHLSGDSNMIEAFKKGQDIHAATASKIFKTALENVDEDMRRKAKTANFGIIYGITPFGLSERLSISRTEAGELINEYFTTFPGVKRYMDKSIEQAREKGYVETILGRKRYLPDINSRNATVRGFAERNAINAPIQGSAADIIKIAMVAIFKKIEEKNLRSTMILQVHDELNFNVLPDEIELMQSIILDEMENAFKLSVPLKTDIGIGENWLTAH